MAEAFAGLNLGKLDYFNPLMIECSNWIDELKTDMSKIRLTMKLDSGIKQIPCKIGAIKGNLIQLQTNLDPSAEYTLALNKGAITDKTGEEADSMSIAFKTTEPEDYASLVLKLQLPKKELPKSPVKAPMPKGTTPKGVTKEGGNDPGKKPEITPGTTKQIIKKTDEIEISEEKKKTPEPKKDDNRQD